MTYMKGIDMSESNDDWVVPQSVDEANERRAQLVEEITHLQSRLTGAKSLDSNIRQMSQRDYRHWRARTARKLTKAQSEITRINNWLREKGGRPKGSAKVKVLPSDDRSPVDTARKLQVYTGRLFALFNAVGEFLETDSDEAYEELSKEYQRAVEVVPNRIEPAQFVEG